MSSLYFYSDNKNTHKLLYYNSVHYQRVSEQSTNVRPYTAKHSFHMVILWYQYMLPKRCMGKKERAVQRYPLDWLAVTIQADSSESSITL